MKGPRAVIFDMDGVIVNSEPWHERAFLDVVADIGYENRHGIQFSEYVGRTDHDLWRDFISLNSPQQSFDELMERKSRRTREILLREQPLFKGLPELVEKLAGRFRLAVASGSDRAVVDAVLTLRGIGRFFQVTISGSDIVRGKPDPEIFLKAAGLLGVAPSDCWVIEDSKPGVAAALAAGMAVVAITNTHTAPELSSATRVVSNYEEVERLLLSARL